MGTTVAFERGREVVLVTVLTSTIRAMEGGQPQPKRQPVGVDPPYGRVEDGRLRV